MNMTVECEQAILKELGWAVEPCKRGGKDLLTAYYFGEDGALQWSLSYKPGALAEDVSNDLWVVFQEEAASNLRSLAAQAGACKSSDIGEVMCYLQGLDHFCELNNRLNKEISDEFKKGADERAKFIEELTEAFGDEFTIAHWEPVETNDGGCYWGYLWMTLYSRDKDSDVNELAKRAMVLSEPVAKRYGFSEFDVLDTEGDGSQGSFDIETWIPNNR